MAKADSRGRILWQKNRLPYGKNTKLNDKQIEENPLQYTNAPLDTHSGLTYLKARYYNAEIGRFYAIDPVWFTEDNVQMFNRYAYANNNPFKYKDPTGEAAVAHDVENRSLPEITANGYAVMGAVAETLSAPYGFYQDYKRDGIGWAVLGIVPGVSEVRKATKAADKTKNYVYRALR